MTLGQSAPGAAGKRIISVSVIDIEMIDLVVPVGAPSANAFMSTTILRRQRERNGFQLVAGRSGTA
jgi:hypothetical protein